MWLTPELDLVLKALGGLGWTVVYVFIIRMGFIDKTYGMPVAVLASNWAWELWYSIGDPHPSPVLYIDYTWAALDTIIVLQALYYGRSIFYRSVPQRWFRLCFLGMFAFFIVAIPAAGAEWDDPYGRYSAFIGAIFISVLFIGMLIHREGVAGQSGVIGVSKLLGNLSWSLLFFLHNPTQPLMNVMFVTMFFFDGLYVVMLRAACRKEGVSFWLRGVPRLGAAWSTSSTSETAL